MFEKFWIGVGDLHGDARNIARIPGIRDAAGVVVSGDITTHGTVDDARAVLDVIREYNPVVMAQIGNMDSESIGDWLNREGMSIHAASRELSPGVGLVGVGYSSPTPFNTPCEVPDVQLGEWLSDAASSAPDWSQVLLVAHDPPFETRVDDVGGGMHVGSRAVRQFIERHQPAACLVGHIHEARFEDRIGDTAIVNPGMLAHGGYACVGLAQGKLSIELKHI